MAQVAYDLNTFAPARQARPERVHEKRRRQRPKARKKYLFTACAIALTLFLVIGVLNTQAKLTELQGEIISTKDELRVAQSEYAAMNLTMESNVNVKTVEERAKALGLIKGDSSRISYVRARDTSNIEVAKTGLAKWLDGAQTGFLDIVQYFMPGK